MGRHITRCDARPAGAGPGRGRRGPGTDGPGGAAACIPGHPGPVTGGPPRGGRGGAITEPALLKNLDRLRLPVRTARGHRPGETPILRTSQPWGIEFESYKDYAPGDDFRYVDWNAVGRLDQLLVKTFTAEREIPFHLLLDTSASMRAPAVDQKFAFTTDLVAALSYVVLINNDTLRLVALSSADKGR